ncbi:hypothetical protein [Sulfobacillus harzensis]|uniref:Uncharacterized protein n=1 Tax=Sulfobacillus harzensis TaxID=2729629 RepID=A0A7Y0L5A2_9FIRM|nr:hypothetical protein [Sulfobacillus harzensis]NMP22710.1 hypothetical protein [Sulfobacillus harzensis]
MIFVEITGWANPHQLSAGLDPAEAVESVLRGEGVEDTAPLHHLPARIGPFDNFREADSFNRLLQGYGAICSIVDDPRA